MIKVSFSKHAQIYPAAVVSLHGNPRTYISLSRIPNKMLHGFLSIGRVERI
jgi:hypothetical protein